jgi:hypothetical protein
MLAMTLAAAGLVIASAALAGASAASEGAPEIAKSPVLQNLAACVDEKKTGDLVVLIDTSGSLSGTGSNEPPTDPTDVRVAGAQALLGGLARSFDQVKADVDVTVAGFDDDVTTAVGFTPLNRAALPDLDGQLAAFADRDRGAETDYWTALTWLNRTLQDKAAQRPGGPGSTCQFAIWFTDGEFTIWPRDGSSQPELDPLTSQTKDIPGFEETPLTDAGTAERAKAAAMEELCRPGGIADQMRASDITLIGVGLGGTDADRFSFMRNYVENPDGSCGAEPGRGVFVPADSVGDLFLGLAAIGELDRAPAREGPNPVCQVQLCPEGTYSFKLDNTISAVHLDAVVDDGSRALIRAGIQVTVTPPSGSPIVIDGNGPDTGTAASELASASFEWFTGGPLSVDLLRSGGQDWTGDWKVTFVDTTGEHPNAVSNIAVTLTSDFAIKPIPVDPESWRVGQSVAIRFQPQTLDGAPIQLTELPAGFTATAEVTLPGPDHQVLQLPVSLTDPVTFDIPAGGAAGLAIVVVKVDGQVAGQALGAVTRQVTVPVQPPFDAPTVAPPDQVVDFGETQGAQARSALLTVQGPEQGDGCVTVTAGPVQGPRDVSAQIATPNGADCFPVPQGQLVAVPLTLTPSTEGNGRLTGDITVALAPSADPQRASDQAVAFRLDMKRLPNPEAKIAVLIAALLIGLLIPLLVMWLVRRMSARFPPAEAATLQSVALDVQIGDRLTLPDGGPLAAPADGWSAVLPPGPGRRTLMLSGAPLRARAGWRLSEPGYAEVDDRTGADSVGAGDALPPHDGKGHPRLPLAVQGTWLVLAPRQLAVSPIDVVQARLVLVVDTAADQAKRAELAGRAGAEAPEAFAEARRRARDASGAPEPPPPPTPVPAGGGWGPPPSAPPGPSGSQPTPGWGAGPQPGSGGGQGAPDWGAANPPATGGSWGPPPPSGGGEGTPPGWGSPGAGGWPDERRRDQGWPG